MVHPGRQAARNPRHHRRLKAKLLVFGYSWLDWAARRPAERTPPWTVLPRLYPRPEPNVDLCRRRVRNGPRCASAQWEGASHNDRAVNSQHLVFQSRHSDIYYGGDDRRVSRSAALDAPRTNMKRGIT